jgi:hypothetical protein
LERLTRQDKKSLLKANTDAHEKRITSLKRHAFTKVTLKQSLTLEQNFAYRASATDVRKKMLMQSR